MEPGTNHSRIGLIRGDGIGPEIVGAGVRVLDALGTAAPHLGLALDYIDIDAGADTYRRTGVACSEADLRTLRDEVDATLKGPVGLPDVRTPESTEVGVLGGVLRTAAWTPTPTSVPSCCCPAFPRAWHTGAPARSAT